ncbi:hypothetical protein L1049_017803 [Liquidambar formosana]|uniref:BURP domain-containing protein n=1 Tax=Liquidambar formosana TaxID=63359 RepID=A0AAP0NJA4_LIQFO
MESHLLPIFAFLCVSFNFYAFEYVAVSHASLPSEVYWQKVLPNTPMPKTIRDRLPPTATINRLVLEKATGSHILTKNRPGKSYRFTYSDKEPTGAGRSYRFTYSDEEPTRTGKGKGYGFTYSQEEPTRTGKQCGFTYSENATEKTSAGELQDDVTYYFFEKDLQPGKKMKLSFTKIPDGDNFLPREVAESIPFSSNKLPEILNRFSINPKGAGAKIEKGKKVQPLSTEVQTGTHDYKIGSGVAMVGSDTVACHQLSYPYAVFYCHATHSTRTYMVTLVDADGVKSKAVAICHIDTSTWNPKNLAFQQLKVKPGTVPVCHFVPNGHIVWVSK